MIKLEQKRNLMDKDKRIHIELAASYETFQHLQDALHQYVNKQCSGETDGELSQVAFILSRYLDRILELGNKRLKGLAPSVSLPDFKEDFDSDKFWEEVDALWGGGE